VVVVVVVVMCSWRIFVDVYLIFEVSTEGAGVVDLFLLSLREGVVDIQPASPFSKKTRMYNILILFGRTN